jgi:exosortase B
MNLTAGSLRHSRATLLPWMLLAAGAAVLYGPTLYDLFTTIWSTDEQGHGPIVLGVVIWLLYQKRAVFGEDRLSPSRPALAYPLLILSLLLYIVARSQGIKSIETATSIGYVISVLLLMQGTAGVRAVVFPLFFMIFMIPLPSVVVDTLTQPMKLAVSYVAESVLHTFGYPISRSGVILQVGQYQLLVADACAGLHTLFTLEALGLLYLNLVRYASLMRNITLAILIVPISFIANVIRVIVLTLITYHFGDEAGQGFLHGFAGMVLFLSALALIIAVDGMLRLVVRNRATNLGGA